MVDGVKGVFTSHNSLNLAPAMGSRSEKKEQTMRFQWMSIMKKIQPLILVLIFSVFALPASLAVRDAAASRFEYPSNMPSPPRLRFPVTEVVVLSGKDYLEFQWWTDFGLIKNYEFRLFRGYNMYAQDLIHKEKLPARSTSIEIKADMFEDNQVYTWSLIKIGTDGLKSDKSFHSFKVIKK